MKVQHRTLQSRTTQRTTTRRTTTQRRATQRRATLIGLVSSLVLAAGTAHADTTTFDNVIDNKWSTPGNWDNGVPGANDRAVIPAGETCNIDVNAVADSIEVASAGTLVIEAGFTLTLDNDTDNASPSGADNSKVDGELIIQGSGAVLKFIDNDHGVSGIGRIEGTHNAARIDIEADIKFTSRLATRSQGIRGALEIKGLTGGTTNGIFRNDGIVHANLELQVLKLATNTVLEDHSTTSTAQWMATKKGILEFNRNATTLKGDFVMSCGEIAIKAHVRTCGEFVWNEGTLSVDTSNIFAYGSYSTLSQCTNPENAVLSVRDCTSWEVDDSNSPYTCGTCDGPE